MDTLRKPGGGSANMPDLDTERERFRWDDARAALLAT